MIINTDIEFKPGVLWEIYNNLFHESLSELKKYEKRNALIVFISLLVFLAPFLTNDFYQLIPFSIAALIVGIFITIKTILKRIKYNKTYKKSVKEITAWIELKSKVKKYKLTADKEKIIIYEEEVPTEFTLKNIIQQNVNNQFIWIRTKDEQTLILPSGMFSAENYELLISLIEGNSKNKNEL